MIAYSATFTLALPGNLFTTVHIFFQKIKNYSIYFNKLHAYMPLHTCIRTLAHSKPIYLEFNRSNPFFSFNLTFIIQHLYMFHSFFPINKFNILTDKRFPLTFIGCFKVWFSSFNDCCRDTFQKIRMFHK